MAKVSGNRIIITEKENKVLQEKLDNITMPHEWVDIVTDIFKQCGLALSVSWSPSVQKHTSWGTTIVGWKGRISGTTTDLGGKNREVHSMTVESEKCRDRNTTLRCITGSGSGGGNFQYGYWILDISKFPKMAEQFPNELDEAFIETHMNRIQKECDDEWKSLASDIKSLKSDAVWSSPEVRKANKYIEEIEAMLKWATVYKKQVVEEVENEVIVSWDKSIPAPPHAMIKPKEYLELKRALTLSGKFLGREHVQEDKIQAFINAHAERFV